MLALMLRVFWLDDQSIRYVMTPRIDIVYIDLNEPIESNCRKKLLHFFLKRSVRAKQYSSPILNDPGRSGGTPQARQTA